MPKIRRGVLSSRHELSSDVSILIVDDDNECLREIYEFLSACRYKASTASTVAEAIESFKAKDYDLLLLDLEMPQMSGIELAHKLFGEAFCQHSILMTGHYEKADGIARQYGKALRVLQKPLKLRGLLDTIQIMPLGVIHEIDLGFRQHSTLKS